MRVTSTPEKPPSVCWVLVKQTKRQEDGGIPSDARPPRRFPRRGSDHHGGGGGSGGGGGGGGECPRGPRQAEPLHRQPNADGVPGLLRQSHGAPLPGLRDRVPGPQHQLGAALHGDGHLVEEEPPEEGRPDRHRHRLGGQREPGGQQGAAKCPTDGLVGM